MALIGLGITAAKAIGSMAAWEIGTQALSWAFDDAQDTEAPTEENTEKIEYDANGNYIGAIGAAGTMGAVYGGKKMFNQRNRKNVPFNNMSNKQSKLNAFENARTVKSKPKIGGVLSTIGDTPNKVTSSSKPLGPGTSAWVSNLDLNDPETPAIYRDISKKTNPKLNTPLTGKHSALYGTGRAGLDKIRNHYFINPDISQKPGSKSLIAKAMKLMPKTKKGKVSAALVLLSAIGTGLNLIGRDKPTNELGDRLLKNALLNKAYESELENALGIDYASRI